MRHFFDGIPDGLFRGGFHGDDERQIVLGVAGFLQHRLEPDVLARQNSGQFRDDPRRSLTRNRR